MPLSQNLKGLRHHCATFKIDKFCYTSYYNNLTVQTAIITNLQSLIQNSGGPEKTIYLSNIISAISNAVGEEANQLVLPTADITASTQQIHRLGEVIFQDF